MKDKDFALEMIDRLNELLEYNEEVRADISEFYRCVHESRPGTVTHPTLQVQLGTNHLSFIGLLNGIAGKITKEGPLKGIGLIAAKFNDDDLIEKFVLTEDLF